MSFQGVAHFGIPFKRVSAIALDNTSTYFYNNRGFDKYKLNDLAGAMADMETAMQKDPDNSFAYKNRALVYIAMKERIKPVPTCRLRWTRALTCNMALM